ncbi:MAG: GTP-binding protein [Syntrophomonadaceae bacterium]|nr:GTP-binding protein [Syntrophomonadaceae bacterium]
MIKVDVVSGFLGAGKTTLIRMLLKAYENERVVLIENEFGEIGIDGELVERDGFDVFEISNGCICCIMKKDFVQVLSRVIEEFKPERIIIEPTGISILSEIIEILRRPEFASLCIINSLLTVVDSVNYLVQYDTFGEFFEDQITNATMLILSKSQLKDEEQIREITESLRQYNKEADIVTKPWSSFGHDEIKGLLKSDTLLSDFGDILHTEYKPCSENEFDTLAIKTSREYTVEELEQVLNRLNAPEFGQVLRGKGFLKGTASYLEFSYTNGQFIVYQSKFKSSGRLCLIGKNLNEKEIRSLFKAERGGLFNWLQHS